MILQISQKSFKAVTLSVFAVYIHSCIRDFENAIYCYEGEYYIWYNFLNHSKSSGEKIIKSEI